jgi:hypothetical protein
MSAPVLAFTNPKQTPRRRRGGEPPRHDPYGRRLAQLRAFDAHIGRMIEELIDDVMAEFDLRPDDRKGA